MSTRSQEWHRTERAHSRVGSRFGLRQPKLPLRHIADLEGPHRKFVALVATSSRDIFDCPCSSSQRLHGRRVGTGGDLLLFDSVDGEVMTICSVPSDFLEPSLRQMPDERAVAW